MSHSWFRSALLATLPQAGYLRPKPSAEVFAVSRVRSKTRSLTLEALETRRLLAADSDFGFFYPPDDSGTMTTGLEPSEEVWQQEAWSGPADEAWLEEPEPDASEEIWPEAWPGDSWETGPETPAELTIEVFAIGTSMIVSEIYEGQGISVAVTLTGGSPREGNYVDIYADADFDGKIDEGGYGTERRGREETPDKDGKYRFYFYVRDDGPSPGNGTPSDSLTIYASHGDTIRSTEVMIKNVAPRIVGVPTVSQTFGDFHDRVTSVIVPVFDPGELDQITVGITWSDNTYTEGTRDVLGNMCGDLVSRSIEVTRVLAEGEVAVPVSLQVWDDDGGTGTDGLGDARFNFERLDVARNDDDDDESGRADLAEWLVPGEDDLRELDLSPLLRPEMTASAGEFYFSYDPARITVWDTSYKLQLIHPRSIDPSESGTTEPPSILGIPYSGQKSVYVEGMVDGLSSIVLSWVPNESLPSSSAPPCAPLFSATFGGSVDVMVWSIDLDIDSDNDDGLLRPQRNEQEEFLEENSYGIGKMLYTDDRGFVPVVLQIPAGLDSLDPDVTVELALESKGSSSGSIRLWNRSYSDPARSFLNEVPMGRMRLADLTMFFAGRGVIYIEPTAWTRNNETKADVDKNGKTDDRLVVTVRAGNLEVKDTVKWMVVGPKMVKPQVNLSPVERLTFYPTLQNSRALRSAGAAEAVYTPSSNSNFTMKMLNAQEIRALLIGRLPVYEIDHLLADLGGVWTPECPEPVADLTIRLYLDHVSLNYVLAFKGTDFTHLDDWIANLQNSLTGNSAQYGRAMRVAYLLRESGITFRSVGHSLGGGIATAASMASGTPADTFNAAGLNPAALYQNDYWASDPDIPRYPYTAVAVASQDFLIQAYNIWIVRPGNDFPSINHYINGEVQDAQDILTYLQYIGSMHRILQPPFIEVRIPAAFQAWGTDKPLEGLFNLTKAESIALEELREAVSRAFSNNWDGITRNLVKGLLLSGNLKDKMLESHDFPSLYFGLLHNRDGWNAYDHESRSY